MRPRPTVHPPIAAVADQVRRLKDKFDYPDEFGQGGSAIVVSDGGGAAPTVVVAASNATDLSQARADFVCTGTNDHLTVASAAAVLGAVNPKGRILLTEGTFTFGAGLFLAGQIHLQGLGRLATIIELTAPIESGGGITTSDLTLDGQGNSITCIRLWGSDQDVHNVHFFDAATAIEGSQDSLITGCSSQLVPVFYDSSDGWTGTTIANSHMNAVGGGVGDFIIGPACDDHLIVGNFISGQIVTDTSTTRDGIHIAGNVWPNNVQGATRAYIDVDGVSGLIVVGNQMWNLGGGDGLYLDTCPDAVVVGNRINNCDRGISIDSTEHALVEGNVIGRFLGEHGILLLDANRCVIAGNAIVEPGQNTNNTFDGIILTGDSNHNYIHGNRITAPASGNRPRYGINISVSTCDNNIYVGNWAGPTANFGTAPYNNAGTGTLNTWPGAAAPQGDNFVL